MHGTSSMVDIAMDRLHVAKKRATLGREKEKEPDIGLQNSYVKFDCMEPLFTSKHALSAVFR
jgi:hypothetical protein